jgi:hypothetical protein
MFIANKREYEPRSNGAQCFRQSYLHRASVSLRWSEEDLWSARSINIKSLRDGEPANC